MKKITSSIITFTFIGLAILAFIIFTDEAQAADAHLDQDGWEWHYDTGTPNTLTKIVQTGSGTELTFPTSLDGVTPLAKVGDYCMADVQGAKITKVLSMPHSLRDIGEGGFVWCVNLISVVLPDDMFWIRPSAFDHCHLLDTIIFTSLNSDYSVGANWISNTASGLRGHASTLSTFPSPGNLFFGLTMGNITDPLPIVTAIPIYSIDESIRYSVSFSCNQFVNWTFQTNASWLSWNGFNVSGTPNDNDQGNYYYNLTASNPNGTIINFINLTVQNTQMAGTNAIYALVSVAVLVLVMTALIDRMKGTGKKL